MKRILVILGTRPEAIKLAPVVLELRKSPEYAVFVCNTEQQKELSGETLGFFGITADCNLDAMLPDQTLIGTQARILSALSGVYSGNEFDATIIQGDTMTVLCGALASFYSRVPVFHVEAGLRSFNFSEPFPEEAIRQMVSRVADLHFAPTRLACDSLEKENIARGKIILTGNTVVDALSRILPETLLAARETLACKGVILNEKLILVTAHRRENHGERLDEILRAVTDLAARHSDHQFVLPVHPNPNVKGKIHAALGDIPNMTLTDPLEYPELVCVMQNAKLILTDSGGIQEEAPTFGTPVLVMRYETERMEGVTAGFAKLVGADYERIIAEASAVLDQDASATRLDGSKNPYGDGHAAGKIVNAMHAFFAKRGK